MKWIFSFFIGVTCYSLQAQSLTGSWQLVRQTTCTEDHIPAGTHEEQALVNDMKRRASASPEIVEFKKNSSGTETTRILNKKKTANPKNFLYKYDGEHLLILDKRSQTLSHTYYVDKLTADSLVVYDVARPCETRIFLKIRNNSN